MRLFVDCREPKKWWQIRNHHWVFDPVHSYIADGYFVSACTRCKARMSEVMLPWRGM